MHVLEPMTPLDLFSLDTTNLDRNSENFTLDYYLTYLHTNPEHFITIKRFDGNAEPVPAQPSTLVLRGPVLGYIFGKVEMKDKLCMHISALSISPGCRNSGLGALMLRHIESNGNSCAAHFADLYVRKSNSVAVEFYKRNGYAVYRHVFDYYAMPIEDAYDMRKPLEADTNGSTLLGGQDIHGNFL
ncbi:N-terminal acetyltransferase B complex catalytic subunit [Pancytospora philotis]|nr:N-terminal acetyltransferase B complex catalytic subunit [Pancytospora philotis]